MRISRFSRSFILMLALLGLALTAVAFAGDTKVTDADRTRAEITTMLTRFLTPAMNNTAAAHDRFWATDLVYTSSAGMLMHKADIMKSFADAPKPDPGKPAQADPVFTAEDILVRPYGDMAALTFRLVEHLPNGQIVYFRNSGTFLRRNGKWQAITWQATKLAADGR